MLIIFLVCAIAFPFLLHARKDTQFRDTMDLIQERGFKGEQHGIITQDGYCLTIHRILPHNVNCVAKKKPPVLLQHGIFASSKSFVVNGPKSALGYVLSEDCFDVWMPNSRGNVFSRNHTHLSPESEEFWDFSWHEMGIYDLPASIDYILAATNSQKLFYIGHSQAVTSYFVMDSLLPSYSDKVVAMTALSPIVFLGPVRSSIGRIPLILKLFVKVVWGTREMARVNGTLWSICQTVFTSDIPLIQKMGKNLLWAAVGPDPELFCEVPYACFLEDYPVGSSSKQALHYLQLMISNKFTQYDYGTAKNLQKYGQVDPPEYPLENARSRYILWEAPGDYLSSQMDFRILANRLPNLHQINVAPWRKFNHIDFVYAIDAKSLVYDNVIQTLNRYSWKMFTQ